MTVFATFENVGYTTAVMDKKYASLAVGTAVIIIAVAWTLYGRTVSVSKNTSSTDKHVATGTEETSITSSGIQYGYTASASSSTPQDLPKGVTMPDLDHSVVIPKSFSPSIAASAREHIKKITSSLREKPGNAALWAELGLERSGIEDYEGAKNAYEYSFALSPYNSVVVDNLGVLYGSYLHDPKRAEQYFLKALDLEPETAFRYLRLFELNKDVLKDNAKAKAILEQGLKKDPGNSSFKALLESL